LNVRKLIVLLFAFSHLFTSLLYVAEYLHEEKKHQIENCKCQFQTESEKINNINLKNEVNMEKKSLEIETAAGQSNTATFTKNKSTVEVH
jgi:hypothetical protein